MSIRRENNWRAPPDPRVARAASAAAFAIQKQRLTKIRSALPDAETHFLLGMRNEWKQSKEEGIVRELTINHFLLNLLSSFGSAG
jgi:hypothetical protein